MKQLLIAFLFFGLISTFSIGHANIPVAQNKDFVTQIDDGLTVVDLVTESQFANNEALITSDNRATDFVVIEINHFPDIRNMAELNYLPGTFLPILKVPLTSSLIQSNYLKRPGWCSFETN